MVVKIFSRNHDHYIERPSETFYSGIYSIFKRYLLYRVFSILPFESKSNKSCEYQPCELDDNLIENNHEECSSSQKINE